MFKERSIGRPRLFLQREYCKLTFVDHIFRCNCTSKSLLSDTTIPFAVIRGRRTGTDCKTAVYSGLFTSHPSRRQTRIWRNESNLG
ncbi:hypothetical protein M378DRAFT_729877 [Amanita muscaria Koide BX008]|uniref:Uncharacterized protein n=1 Tax=Amanita muscaria (strain Koide BX008) TaxID=946122 RepID=A0A0C2SIY8_AMAMK|nr:hypothetical protein M378DRAFT_729877 [Amanita muscaria Koide BX008]